MSPQLLSESDFVTNRLFFDLKTAAKGLGMDRTVDLHTEVRVDGGKADLVVEHAGRRVLVLEAKYKKRIGGVERLIEPRDPEVVAQAIQYAMLGGYPFYATCNPKRLVLFKVMPGRRPYESEVAAIEIQGNPGWAEEVLKVVLGVTPASAKAVDDSLVETLHEAYVDLRDEFLASLRGRLKDPSFEGRFVEWLRSQGLEYNDENIRKTAEQTTYLQINKLLFYNVVRTLYPDRLRQITISDEEDVFEVLSEHYTAIRRIDYAPIYQPDLISEIPFTERAKERFRTLIDSLNEYDFSRMESDFLGRVYEKLIPPAERKRLGQFYTPPEIVDLIARLTIKDGKAKVLDPACGSGSFLVKAYHRLRELNGIPKEMSGQLGETFHRQLLSQVYGVDINQFPSHLSVINLAIQNPRARIDAVNVVVKDFFDLRPRQETLTGFKSMDAAGKEQMVKIPYSFDAVVANPPYIRQELLGEKEKEKIYSLVQDEFKDLVYVGKKPGKGDKRAVVLDRMSDIYVYFYIHSIRFLRQGGMLGFISSNKWLEVGYGEPFQEFLLRTVKILYVIEFDRAVFPDAEVDTAITILQKESDPEKRRNNTVRFVRVKKPIGQAELMKLLESEEDADLENARIAIIQQKKLKPGKWNVYLRAPPVFKKLINHPKMKPLGEVAEVIRGPTTGYNDYFILSKEKAKEWGIEPEFLVPCVSSPKKVKGLVIKPEDIDEYFFMCDKPKDELKGTNALKYIEWGEKLEVEVTRGSKREMRKLPELETVKGRKLWYALPKLKTPQILFPYMVRGRSFAILNKASAHAVDVFHYIITPPGDEIILVSFMNSSIFKLFLELISRQYTGMLKIQVYDLKSILSIDPKEKSDKLNNLQNIFEKLVEFKHQRIKAEEVLESLKSTKKGQPGILELEARKDLEKALEAERKAQKELDEAVYDILGLTEEERRQVEEGLRELQELRRARTRI
ncbi:MAG: N-6 DNA methylase [Candidatus Methanosuratus sp.]|nr:N-6 DNA methylase [Candidatus Methanosuratincola sp.]